VASSFALVRFVLVQVRSLTDQFVGHLEGALTRQEEANARLVDALAEHSAVLRRIEERLR
jgi:uncharacterized coiled-coil protein SlyX